VKGRIPRIGALVGLALLTASTSALADGPRLPDRVATILERRCVGCHQEPSPKGGLSLATRSSALKGGRNGSAVVAGKPQESILLDMITGDPPEMPRKGQALTEQEVAAIRAWIEQGASWPEGTVLTDRRFDGQHWWSLEPLSRPPVPAARQAGWARTPIDAFIFATLRKRGLQANGEADRPTLIRRVYFDLIGLPPEPSDIRSFLNDPSPDAYERLVDRLLASPHYGERWGRHWLDVVHYGDTHGYDKDKRRDNAWRYRDYVICSFNADVPYGRFIQEQLAGDVLWPGDPKGIIATGFIAAGPWDFVGHVELREGTVDKLKTRALDRDDMVSSTMATFASMTVHCARCHDHKLDPITQTDYYRLQAVFSGVDRGDRPFETPELAAQRAFLQERRAAASDRHAALARKTERLTAQKLQEQRDRLADQLVDPTLRELRDAALAEVKRLDTQLQSLGNRELAYTAIPHAPRPIMVLRRGDVEQHGREVGPGALACVPGLPGTFALPDPADEGSRRAALAGWLASSANMLTWRSIANRLWHYHFGRGIVETPNDFGRNGALPTHPDLLDWLAVELRDGRQSQKALHRAIVTSSVYRASAQDNPAYRDVDADNRYLWRQNRRRLDAEAVRDSVLAIAGTLDRRMGGPGYEAFAFKDDHSPVYDHSDPEKVDNPEVRRRSVYRFIVRSVPNPFMEALDCADPNLNTPVRSQTLTALQALALWNDLFMLRQSRAFARRLEQLSPDRNTQIVHAFEWTLGRAPTVSECDALASYADRHGLAPACRLLWNTNAFIFVD
jgi:mono/diheme cytochrome c family protein